MKSLFVSFVFFSAAAVANDTSYPKIEFETGTVETVRNYADTHAAIFTGGDADTLFKILGTPVGTGPKEYYDSQAALVLVGRNAKSGLPMFVSIQCSKNGWDLEKGLVPFDKTRCSVAIVDGPYQSDLHQFSAPVCK